MMKVFVATLYASITYLPILLVMAVLMGGLDNSLLGIVVVTGFFVSLACVSIIGVPAHLSLEMHGKKSSLHYATIGFILPFGFVLLAQPFGKDGAQTVFLQSIQFGLHGLAAAFVFCWFAARSTQSNGDE